MDNTEKLISAQEVKEFLQISGIKNFKHENFIECHVNISKLDKGHWFPDKIKFRFDEFNNIFYLEYDYLRQFGIYEALGSNKYKFTLKVNILSVTISDCKISFRL